MRRVVIINDFATVHGGADQVAIQSAVGFANEGFEVTFIAGVSGVDERLRSAGVRVENAGGTELLGGKSLLRAAVTGIYNTHVSRRLGEILKRFSPADSCVHIHSWTKALTCSIMPVLRRFGFKPVITMHDYFLACPNGSFLIYPTTRICGLRPLGARCLATACDKRKWSHKVWRVVRQLIQQAVGMPRGIEYFISLSALSESVMRKSLPSHARIFRVNNPAQRSTTAERVRAETNKDVIFVGRLAPEKAPLLFAEAAKRVGMDAVFVGDGEQRELIANVNPGAIFTGWLDAHGVSARMMQARALVFPSVWLEAQPLVILDALSLGIPVVVSDLCAGREFVENDVTGLHFKGGELEDMVRALEIIQDDAAVEAMSRNAFERGRLGQFALQAHTAKLLEIYREVVAAQATTMSEGL